MTAVPITALDRWMSNGDAMTLGFVARKVVATNARAGDDIDRGLRLVRLLAEAGFSVVRREETQDA